MNVEEILFEVSEALRFPVLTLAVLALVVVLVELGALLAELYARRRRSAARLENAVDEVRAALARGDREGARDRIEALGFNSRMRETLGAIVELRDHPDAGERIPKRVAEFDYRSLRRLERTRILVRAGPALGLMGTLIPLSPALAGLARGDVEQLTRDLRVAFSVTVAGLLIGMIAFAISLVRDRLYAQDYSDVEYVMASLAHRDGGGATDASRRVEAPALNASSAGVPAGASRGSDSPDGSAA